MTSNSIPAKAEEEIRRLERYYVGLLRENATHLSDDAQYEIALQLLGFFASLTYDGPEPAEAMNRILGELDESRHAVEVPPF